jgi:hypothetical protein
MADKNNQRGIASGPGVIHKAASLGAQEITEAELRAINAHTLEPLTAEEVFTFKAVLCDNEVDRDFERFTLTALQDLQRLYNGKTVIKDHSWVSDNQVARIYATELVADPKALTSTGEAYTQLVAHCYMVKTDSNADLIAEIKAGIKKEGSIGFATSSCICSICGTDNAKNYCRHWPGKSYEKEGGPQVCTFTLAGARDAYEFSLVAVPAQKAAGVSKSYTGETVYEEREPAEPTEPTKADNHTPNSEKSAELALRARLVEARAKLLL